MNLSLEQLLENLRAKLLRFCLYYSGSKEDAEDAVQATFLKVLTNSEKVHKADNPEAYVYSIARNICKDRLHYLRRFEQFIGLKIDLAFRKEAENPAAFLHKLILMLPEQQKLVFILRIMLDKSENETALILGLSAGTIKSQLSRAMRFLRHKTGAKNHDNQI